ncbi:MAG: hypothetical protein J6W30_02070 [Bacteroidales bacterium]|nr:hypothetical protein [Bacteroidales bacterium]
MGKLITFLTFFLISVQLKAQDVAILNSIENTNSKIKTFEADLANTNIKPKKTTFQEGKLLFVAPKKFSAQFTSGKYMIVNENRIKANIGMFHGTFRLREGGMIRSLSNVFLYGFQGRIRDLANENGYTLSTKTENGFHIVIGTIKKKSLLGVGFQQVFFKYYTDSLLLKEIVLYDYNGNKDIYTISNVKYDVAVDKSKFEF